jgi:type IV pilus assembly protein PilC
MPYKAGSDHNRRSQCEASNQAIDKLRSNGLSILELKEVKERATSSFLSNEKPVKMGDITLFSRQLASMLGAGIPVTRAINTLGKQPKIQRSGRPFRRLPSR